VLALATLYLAGLGTRRAVLATQYQLVGDDLPFTLESALHYRRVKMVYDTGRMPEIDQAIQYPEGVNVRETYNYGPEIVQAWLAKCLPSTETVAQRLRWVESGWFCLGIVFMALWLLWWQRSWWAAVLGSSYYAVGIASVIRSTGQELSRENFALPLLLAHLAFRALALRVWGGAAFFAAGIVSAAFLGLSMASWDLIQIYVLLWLGASLVGMARGDIAWGSRPAKLWLLEAAALVAVGAASPYYRAHGWLLSPTMGLVYGAALWLVVKGSVRPFAATWTAGWRRWLVLLAPVALLQLLFLHNTYTEAYGHFGELMWAKLRHLNHKPADPAALTFYQRIMWVPALHSATIPLTFQLFPATLCLSLFAAPWVCLQARSPGIGRLAISFGASFIAFCFFARFHVFLSLFACALLGVWAAWAGARVTWLRGLVLTLLVAGLAVEAGHTWRDPQRWGRTNVYYREMDELATWLREHVAPEPVLANFGVSAYIAAYAKCPIFLHPKFESAAVRNRVQAYGEKLFKGTEREFRDWADALGARYYVYALGEFAPAAVEQQMRYMVNALDPAESAAARVLETRPDEARYFRRLWGNRKYTAFSILSRKDEEAAGQFANRAELALQQGDLPVAEREAARALELDRGQARAIDVLKHVTMLQAQGFEYERVQE
jgi:hypothetical protein